MHPRRWTCPITAPHRCPLGEEMSTMLDARLRPLIDPPLNHAGHALAGRGITANFLTALGLLIGLVGAVALAGGHVGWGLALIVTNRLMDGLDGAVARACGPTDIGGYFDVVADFAFYVAVPVGFGFMAPEHARPALVLVASFVLTGASFLAFAIIAAKRQVDTHAHGRKSFFYSTGLAEGTETIVVFIMMCLAPAWFGPIAYAYALLCVLTVVQRSVLAASRFGD